MTTDGAARLRGAQLETADAASGFTTRLAMQKFIETKIKYVKISLSSSRCLIIQCIQFNSATKTSRFAFLSRFIARLLDENVIRYQEYWKY